MRGSSEFTTMKGFMDGYVVKGGESPETLPADQGELADGEKLQDKATGGEPKKGKRVTNAPDLTMADDVSMVEEEAKKDIADGYVSDVQDKSKGYQAFDSMVKKGMAVDIELNPASDFKTTMKEIQDLGEEMVTKTLGSTASKVGTYLKDTAQNIGSAVGRGSYKLGKKLSQTGTGDTGRVLSAVGTKLKRVPKMSTASKEKLGYGVMGGGTLATGAGAKKLASDKEDKCASMPMKNKGFDSEE